MSEFIEKLNGIFGDDLSKEDKVMFAVHISENLCANETVMTQIRNNSRE